MINLKKDIQERSNFCIKLNALFIRPVKYAIPLF